MAQGTELGSIELRNKYTVYADGNIYRVVSTNGRQQFASIVSRHNVDILANALKGQSVSVDDVLDRIERGTIKDLTLNSRGYKIRYEVQYLLLSLVARGDATVERDGRKFVYHLRASAGQDTALA